MTIMIFASFPSFCVEASVLLGQDSFVLRIAFMIFHTISARKATGRKAVQQNLKIISNNKIGNINDSKLV